MLLLGIWFIATRLLQVVSIHVPAMGTVLGSACDRWRCFDPGGW